MDDFTAWPPTLNDRMATLWQRGVRLMTRLAIALGLSVVSAILLGAAVTDNGFVQILVTVFAALGLWIPFALLVTWIDRLFNRRRPSSPAGFTSTGQSAGSSWHRLHAVAHRHSERLRGLARSLDRSRLALGKADLDPDAHDLCVLIDRRLPELIDRELDMLAPDDRNRARQLDDLVDLIDQFARHCSSKRAGDVPDGFEAQVLRRRFEDRLGSPQLTTLRPPQG